MGQLIAGPQCSTILGYFGAEVIKVEQPGGDPIRTFRKVDDTNTSMWWRSIGRNKKSICLDLKVS
jgi:crotonobetainyl-CoA:carnitine CoA-transferase CaiB-like acyl-CoA transferase